MNKKILPVVISVMLLLFPTNAYGAGSAKSTKPAVKTKAKTTTNAQATQNYRIQSVKAALKHIGTVFTTSKVNKPVNMTIDFNSSTNKQMNYVYNGLINGKENIGLMHLKTLNRNLKIYQTDLYKFNTYMIDEFGNQTSSSNTGFAQIVNSLSTLSIFSSDYLIKQCKITASGNTIIFTTPATGGAPVTLYIQNKIVTKMFISQKSSGINMTITLNYNNIKPVVNKNIFKVK